VSCNGNCEGCSCGTPSIDVTPLVGKTMLAGITVCDHTGKMLSHHAVWGTVRGTNAAGWLEVELHGKADNPIDGTRVLCFPTDVATIETGDDDDEFHLRDTDEVIVAPDFIARLRVA
jgi:hypothetical protein